MFEIDRGLSIPSKAREGCVMLRAHGACLRRPLLDRKDQFHTDRLLFLSTEKTSGEASYPGSTNVPGTNSW